MCKAAGTLWRFGLYPLTCRRVTSRLSICYSAPHAHDLIRPGSLPTSKVGLQQCNNGTWKLVPDCLQFKAVRIQLESDIARFLDMHDVLCDQLEQVPVLSISFSCSHLCACHKDPHVHAGISGHARQCRQPFTS